jgi:hypothetical protein
MIISLQLFLYIYCAFIAIYLIFVLFNLYHLIKFGFLTFGNVFISFIFIGVTVILLFFSFVYINTIDWTQSFTIFDMPDINTNTFMP